MAAGGWAGGGWVDGGRAGGLGLALTLARMRLLWAAALAAAAGAASQSESVTPPEQWSALDVAAWLQTLTATQVFARYSCPCPAC